MSDSVGRRPQARDDDQYLVAGLLRGGEPSLRGSASSGALRLNGRQFRTRTAIPEDELATFVVRLGARAE